VKDVTDISVIERATGSVKTHIEWYIIYFTDFIVMNLILYILYIMFIIYFVFC
jgi:hypothetical protein